MDLEIKPKLENADKGFSDTVTQAQLAEYKKCSLKEHLQQIWGDTNVFLT